MDTPDDSDYDYDYVEIPRDVVGAIVQHTDRKSVAGLRLLCKAWREHVDATIREVELGTWPSEPSFMEKFRVLGSCQLRPPALVQESHVALMPRILEVLARLAHLQALSICHTGPPSLASLSLLTGLTSLSISRGAYPDTRFQETPHLPPQVTAMTRLRHLKLCNTVPNHTVLQSMRSLRSLELVGHTLKARTPLLSSGNPLIGLDSLTQLETLIARCNYGVSRLPPLATPLPLLRHLDLSKNMLCALPPSISSLAALTHLDLASNCLSAIPDEIGSLTRLRFLDLSTNSRLVLPESLRRLGSSLRVLRLNWVWSDLSVLFSSASAYTALEELQLTGNGLALLPPSVALLSALLTLTLTMNSIEALPSELGSMTTLQYLELSDNRLSALPPSLGGLVSLRALGLRSNNLTALPPQLGALSSLTTLDLSMNQVSDLPSTLTGLQALCELALNFNPLRCLPPQLASLSCLRVLELYYVRLQPYTRQVCDLQATLPCLFIFTGCMCPRAHCSVHNPLRTTSTSDAPPDPLVTDISFHRGRPPTHLLGADTPPLAALVSADVPTSSTIPAAALAPPAPTPPSPPASPAPCTPPTILTPPTVISGGAPPGSMDPHPLLPLPGSAPASTAAGPSDVLGPSSSHSP